MPLVWRVGTRPPSFRPAMARESPSVASGLKVTRTWRAPHRERWSPAGGTGLFQKTRYNDLICAEVPRVKVVPHAAAAVGRGGSA